MDAHNLDEYGNTLNRCPDCYINGGDGPRCFEHEKAWLHYELERIEKLIDLVKNQGLRGAKLIQNVRKLSQIEEGNISLRSMDICKTLTK